MKLSMIISALALMAPLVAAYPTQVLATDFPDPAIIYDVNSGQWFVFATAGNGLKIQVASGRTSAGPWTWHNIDLLPQFPSWAVNTGIWAPDVRYLPHSKSFIIYYSAVYAADTRFHCVGAATAKSITGPYTPIEEPIACPISRGGAIDSSGYHDDATNTQWVVYKIDGNAVGHGGSCGNSVEPIVSTPIMMQQVGLDGHTKIGSAFELLDRDEIDGPLIEAPNLIKHRSGTYILFFSSNCYTSSLYDISYATSQHLKGPYKKAKLPLLVTPDYGLEAPGGAQASWGGGQLVFHANCPQGRCLYETTFKIENNVIKLT